MFAYSPRQGAAFLTLAEARKREDDARAVIVAAYGSRGDDKAIKKYQDELLRGA